MTFNELMKHCHGYLDGEGTSEGFKDQLVMFLAGMTSEDTDDVLTTIAEGLTDIEDTRNGLKFTLARLPI